MENLKAVYMNLGKKWQTQGQGLDLILIHGWGMNAGVWQHILARLTPYYRVHCLDLPGYGFHQDTDAFSLDEMAQYVLSHAPKGAIWIGWSLGGMVAMRAAKLDPNHLSQLITVASSPCFISKDNWIGTDTDILIKFCQQLKQNQALTIERFIALQALGCKTARQDIKALKQDVIARPCANLNALKKGLDILQHQDMRNEIKDISIPWLRIYGRLDRLVPYQSIQDVDALAPKSTHFVLEDASHAPFISAPDTFIQAIDGFCRQ